MKNGDWLSQIQGELEADYQYSNCVSMPSKWLDPSTSSISNKPCMEYYLGQAMIPHMLTVSKRTSKV